MHQFDIWLRNYGKVFLNTISLQKLKDLFLEDFNKLVLERKLWNIDVEGKVYGWCSFYPIISSIDNVKITNIYYYLDFEIEHIESKLDAIKRKVNEVIDSPQ
jgi:hypothetical protein